MADLFPRGRNTNGPCRVPEKMPYSDESPKQPKSDRENKSFRHLQARGIEGVQEPGITDLGITESGITESGITGGNRKRV